LLKTNHAAVNKLKFATNLICEKNLLTKRINYPDIKGMKTLDHLTFPVNTLSVSKIIWGAGFF
jgi:hypothetical protein